MAEAADASCQKQKVTISGKSATFYVETTGTCQGSGSVKSSGSNKLSAGDDVGVAIACLIGIVAVGALVVRTVRQNQRNEERGDAQIGCGCRRV